MIINRLNIVIIMIFGMLVCIPSAFGEIPPGGTGWIAFKTNVPDATVYINGNWAGTTDSGGEFDIQYDASYTSYTIENDAYYSKSGSIEMTPGADNLEISVTLTPKPVGSGKGYYTVYCSVNGATVSFDGKVVGTIANGEYTQTVSTTGTAYSTYSVSKSGYYTYTDSISSVPSDGQTIYLYATLNPVTTAPTTIETMGGSTGYYTIHCGTNGASVYFDNTYKGVISNGVLSVMVYTTATPYSTYSVSAGGYNTAAGSLPSISAGQIRDIYVTLSPTTVVTTATVPPAGSGQGTYAIYCTIDGAKVYFDNTYQGTITNGVLYDSVSVTGTPYTTYRIEADGYVTKSGSITQYPSAGEIVTMTVNLTKVPATTVPATTKAPLSLGVVLAGLIGAAVLVMAKRT